MIAIKTIEPRSAPQDTTKSIWVAPAIQTIDMSRAEGGSPGPHCDKHGSLSTNSGGFCGY
jgi:hypothetical protein